MLPNANRTNTKFIGKISRYLLRKWFPLARDRRYSSAWLRKKTSSRRKTGSDSICECNFCLQISWPTLKIRLYRSVQPDNTEMKHMYFRTFSRMLPFLHTTDVKVIVLRTLHWRALEPMVMQILYLTFGYCRSWWAREIYLRNRPVNGKERRHHF